MHNFIVYVGKDNTTLEPNLVKNLGSSRAVVAKLMSKLQGKGYHLYIDNWYSSVPLAKYLSQRRTGVCGTIRKNRQGLPKRLTSYKKLKKGEFIFRSAEGMLVVKLQDTKEVMFLSTLHRAEVAPTGKRDRHRRIVKKLKLVHQYNHHMGGVDRNDAMLSFYTAARKSTKWYKKLATHFIEECLLNAFILYGKSGGKKRQFDFIRLALKELLNEGLVERCAHAQQLQHDPIIRLSGRHFPGLVPATEKKKDPQKKCVVCYARGSRKDRRYCCLECPGQPGLCPSPCFQMYHTKLDYS